MSKKVVVMFLSILLIGAFISPNPTIAAGQDYETQLGDHHVQPMWKYIGTFANAFDIYDWGKAIATCTISSLNADELSVEINLQQFKDNKWTTIRTWSNREDAPYAAVEGIWYVMSGYRYRITTIGMAYKNGTAVERTTYISDPIEY